MKTRTENKIGSIAILAMLLLVVASAPAFAQSPGFDMVGFIQKATVIDASNPLSGGTITINNHTIIVPANSIIQMPAQALGWGEVFSLAPATQKSMGESGLAMSDTSRLPGTFEAHVQGSIVGTGPNAQYIAGLIFLSQQSLNTGQGFIDSIDYNKREIHVNGTVITINDPTGRFSGGVVKSPDVRFGIDNDNPTIRSESAYPMCLAKVAPPAVDPLCPETNRTKDTTGKYFTIMTMPDPKTVLPGMPDPRVASPFEVGDFITYAGVLQADGTISAYQIIGNVGIYTWHQTDPAYIAIDVLLQGTGAPFNQAVGIEATSKVRVEGFSTDTSRTVDIYAMDNLCGQYSDRWWATVVVDPGPPTGAKLGRFRYQPTGGAFLPPSQYVRVRVTPSSTCLTADGFPCGPTATEFVQKNGLVAGQYFAPNFDFIFPETLAVGGMPTANNFGDFPWLVNGVGNWNGVASGQLSPWPDTVAPTPTCSYNPPPPPVAPVAFATATPTSVLSGDVITLDGTASQAAPTDTYQWTQTAGPSATITNPNSPSAFVFAPPVSSTTTLTFKLTISNSAGTSSAQASVTVNPKVVAAPPVILSISAASPVGSGSVNNKLSVVASDPSGLALTYSWTQTAGVPGKIASPTSASTTFTAPVVALGGLPVTITFQVTVKNALGLVATQTVNVTVLPPPDFIQITSVQYVRNKARLTVTVTDNISSPNIQVTCSIPIINPATGKNYTAIASGQGTYTDTFVGIPLPASVSCWSSANPSNIQTAFQSQFQIK